MYENWCTISQIKYKLANKLTFGDLYLCTKSKYIGKIIKESDQPDKSIGERINQQCTGFTQHELTIP